MKTQHDIEPISLLYYTKKAILVYERVFGHTPSVSRTTTAQLRSINSKEEFENICTRIQKNLNNRIAESPLSEEDEELLQELKFTSFLELAEEGDFSLITQEYHGNHFFNEIPNDNIINALIASFIRLWELPSDGPCFIEVYDIGDKAIFFKDEEHMKTFLDTHDATPYTAFAVKEGRSVELWSE